MKKKVLMREKMINLLKKMPAEEKKRQTEQVLSNLTQSENWKKAYKVALYMAQDFEFDLSALFDSPDKEILIPKTLPERQMIFVKYDPQNLTQTKFGLLEPVSNLTVRPDLIIVPGLAWNVDNYRIGFGGGYYDRYLAHFSGHTASVIYDFQRLDFTAEAHDIAVDTVFQGQKEDSLK